MGFHRGARLRRAVQPLAAGERSLERALHHLSGRDAPAQPAHSGHAKGRDLLAPLRSPAASSRVYDQEKELNFFNSPGNVGNEDALREYAQHFAAAGDATIVGETSPSYFWHRDRRD